MDDDTQVQVLVGILKRLERLERMVARSYSHDTLAPEIHDIRSELHREVVYDFPTCDEAMYETAKMMLGKKVQT